MDADSEDGELEELNRAIAARPADAALFRKRASRLRALRRDELAIRDYGEAIRLDPGCARDHVGRGSIYRGMGLSELALKDLDAATSIEPGQPWYYISRAEQRADAGDATGALAEYGLAIERFPAFTKDCLRHRAKLLAGPLAKPLEALADYTGLILDDADFSDYEDRGDLYTRLGRKKEAVADYLAALEHDPYPDAQEVLFGKCAALFGEMSDWRRVSECCDRWIDADGTSMWARAWRGVARSRLGEYAGALEDFAIAEERMDWKRGGLILDPDGLDPELGLRNFLARFFATAPEARSRDGARGVRLAREACEYSGWSVAAYVDTYAAACAEAGDFDEAVRLQLQALASPEFEIRSGDVARDRLALYRAMRPFHEVRERSAG